MNDQGCYPETDILINKQGFRSENDLREFEYGVTTYRIAELRETPVPGRFDLPHLQKIHAHVFQDIYQWAGDIRHDVISKGDTKFVIPQFIESEAKRLTKDLHQDNQLCGLDKNQFVDRLAHHYAEWNALHPFREGNGRAIREFFGQMSQEAGYTLDQGRIDAHKGDWNQACAASFKGNLQPLREIFQDAVRPNRSYDLENLGATESLAKHPELKNVVKNMEKVEKMLKERFPNDEGSRQNYMAKVHKEIVRQLDAGKLPSPGPEKTRPTVSPREDKNKSSFER